MLHTVLLHSELLCFLCIMMLILCLLFCCTQNYLAKNKQSSLFYWRNVPCLAEPIFHLARIIHIEHAVLAAEIALSSDQKIKLIITSLHLRSFRLKKLFEKFDDMADNMLPEEILALGNPMLSLNFNYFLENILDEENLIFIAELIRKKYISEHELRSFCTLITQKHYIQAQLSIHYKHENNPLIKAKLRQQLSQENIELTGIYFAFFSHLIKKDKRILDFLSGKEHCVLSYKLLKKVYPSASLAGELNQIKHDMTELRYDLAQEPVLGKISPNYFLMQIEKNAHLSLLTQELNTLPDRPVNYYELPSLIQEQYLELRTLFINQAFKLGTIAGMILIVTWEYQYRVGFYTKKPRSWRNPN